MDESLNKQLEFERLLFEISSKFVNLQASEVDREINDALEKIAGFLGFDQSVFGEFKGEDGSLQVVHGYTAYRWQEHKGLILNVIAPKMTEILRAGGEINLPRLPDDLPDGWEKEARYVKRVGLKSCVGISLKVGGTVLGVIIFESYRNYKQWTDPFLQQLKLVALIFANALERKQTDIKLKEALERIRALSRRLRAENRYLRETISSQGQYEDIVGRSRSFKEVLGKIEQVAGTDSTVLFSGETGTGKTRLARLLHQLSSKRNKTMIKVNCATLPPNLLESELFGHEKGAFTGAVSKKIGRFEIAAGSTLFLDEIGELPLELQAKLLKVLDDGEFERLGGTKALKANVRIIAATNRDLVRMVKEGKFRSDLFYRLNVYPIHVPSLRKRVEDIPEMVWGFVEEFCKTMGKRIDTIPQKNFETLLRYPWPGNIRELKNVIENAMISCRGNTLYLLSPEMPPEDHKGGHSLAQIQRSHILNILKQVNWKVKGPGGAAEVLDLNPSTLYSKMKKLGISPARAMKTDLPDLDSYRISRHIFP